MSASSPTPNAPRYRQLADMLIQDIESGRFAVGELLPPEFDLCQQYDMSRHTVREALRTLADLGLVVRKHGIGTQVKARVSQNRYVASLSTLSDLFQYTQTTQLKVVSEAWLNASPEEAALLHCPVGQRWLKFETCRYPIGETTPISFTEIYVYPAYQAVREHLDGRSVWVYGVIEQLYGERIVEVQQETDPIATPEHVAAILGAEPGTPALHTRRYYLGANDRLLSVSVNIYPQHRFTLRTRWRLEKPGTSSGE